MKLVWSARAINRVEEIRSYISREAPMTADKVSRRIIISAERLKEFPLIGRVVPEYSRKEVREIIEAPYRIIYLVKTDRVEITVLHSRQLLQ